MHPPNALLRRLVDLYAAEPLRYPQLRAITLAQWLLESGRATSALAIDHYNFGGLKWRDEMAPFATRVRYKAHDGPDYYCKFPTLDNFVAGYWAFLNRSPYSGWEEHTDTPQAFIDFIGPIYAGRRAYPAKVLALLKEAETLLAGAGTATGRAAGNGATARPKPATADSTADTLGTIVIDPGHGGTVPLPGSSPNNAISVSGVKEKTLTLDFALILRDALLEQARMAGERIEVVLTRTADVNVAGADRAGTAKRSRAKAFLSLHFNGNAAPGPSGVDTYVRAQTNGNVNFAADKAFAQAVQRGVLRGLTAINPATRNRGVKQDSSSAHAGGLAVLSDHNLGNVGAAKPSVAALAEIEFITNPAIDTLLVSGPQAIANRTVVMAALAEALRGHLRTLP